MANQDQKPNKWKEAGYGALQGLQNWVNHTNKPIESYNDIRIARKNAPILAKIGAIEHQDKLQQEKDWNQTRIKTTLEDDARQRDNLARQTTRDERNYEIKTKTLDWKKDDRDRYYELENVKIEAKAKNDERTYKLAEQKQKELERHNGVTEKQQATNEQGRNDRTDKLITGRTNVATIQQGGQTTRANIKTGAEASKVLAAIAASAPAGTTPEQIKAKQDEYLNTLPSDIKAQIPR
jgi:hypothetical protein